jgi:hypothetical protein
MIIGVFLTAVTVTPFVGSTMVGAVSGRTTEATAHLMLTAHATRDCGPVTFEFSAGNPVSYFQIHATGVSCAVAKTVVVKGGKYDGVPPAGWTYLSSGERGSNCNITWKHGAARVTAYWVNNGDGC